MMSDMKSWRTFFLNLADTEFYLVMLFIILWSDCFLDPTHTGLIIGLPTFYVPIILWAGKILLNEMMSNFFLFSIIVTNTCVFTNN